MYVESQKQDLKIIKNMLHEFRPYIMFTNAHNYKSKSVSTRSLGFRKVFLKKIYRNR